MRTLALTALVALLVVASVGYTSGDTNAADPRGEYRGPCRIAWDSVPLNEKFDRLREQSRLISSRRYGST